MSARMMPIPVIEYPTTKPAFAIATLRLTQALADVTERSTSSLTPIGSLS